MELNEETDGARQSSPDRLMNALLWHWEHLGSASTSTRSLCRSAGVQMASLYHHFESVERLFLEGQAVAQDRTEQWLEERLDMLRGLALPPLAIGAFLAAMIDDWCGQQRQLAFAWRECGLLAARQARFRPALARWNNLWQRFWSQAAHIFGLGDHAAITGHFFLGQSIIHMIPWQPVFDRASLQEACAGWASWLQGHAAPASPWFDLARSQAESGLARAELSDDIARRIAAAAAGIVEAQGVGRLTHRAVAAEAGVSLGTVSHRFRTVTDLIAAAFETMYQKAVGKREAIFPDKADAGNEALARWVTEGALGGPNLGLGNDELLIACARGNGLHAFAAQLRYMRGRSGIQYLQLLAGPGRAPRAIDAFIFSSFMIGLIATYGTIEDRAARLDKASPYVRSVSAMFIRSQHGSDDIGNQT